jgi:hypothetical protein
MNIEDNVDIVIGQQLLYMLSIYGRLLCNGVSIYYSIFLVIKPGVTYNEYNPRHLGHTYELQPRGM